MRRLPYYLILAQFALPLNVIAPSSDISYNNVKPKPVLIIDPGHDIKHTGRLYVKEDANGKKTHYKEEEIVFDIAQRLENLVNDYFTVYLTREDEQPINVDSIDYDHDGSVDWRDETRARPAFAEEKDAYIFISLHTNAYKNTHTRSTEIYIFGIKDIAELTDDEKTVNLIDSCTVLDNNSFTLASALADNSIEKGRNTYFLASDFHVIEEMPASINILVELGCITNKYDRKLFSTEEGKDFFANLLAEPLIEYIDKL